MNKITPFLALCLSLFAPSTDAQVAYTANDTIFPFDGRFRYGANLGVFFPWRDEMLADIAAGNPEFGAEGVGVDAVRPSLPDIFVDFWGFDIRVDAFKHYDSLGIKDNVVFVGYPSDRHRDSTFYCPNGRSEMFANMYEPIWDNGENGTPVNDSNYYALYLWNTVNTYTPWVKFWEIWNEPDFDFIGGSSRQPGEEGNWWEYDPNPCDYALHAPVQHYIRLLRISYEIIKTAAPNDYVCLGGVGYPSFVDVLLRNTDNPDGGTVTPEFPLAGGAYFDVVSFHSYPHIDNSLRVWDDQIFGFKYFRHSDRCVDGMLARQAQMRGVCEGYGYDGVTFPEKKWIITESNIPRVAYDEFIGSAAAQINYIIKALVACQQNDILQFHVYQLSEIEPLAKATTEFHLMGLYQCIDSIIPYTQKVNPVGVAYKTTADQLRGKQFDPDQTAKLQLPDNVRGGAFRGADGHHTYVLWAQTQTDRSESASATYSFPASLNIRNLHKRNWSFSNVGITALVDSENVPLTGEPIFLADSRSEPPTEHINRIELTCNPNPFKGEMTIGLALPEPMVSSLGIYDMAGRQVYRFFSNLKLAEGEHHINMDGEQMPAGVYILRFESVGGRRVVCKLVKG